ncbi:MAG: hypothetical protein IKG14_02210 [Clostridia bacterium]|nr:hypothetical protein [Clostridia bacterium]
MKNKKLFCIFAILIIIALVIGSIIYINKNKTNNDEIPNGYIAIFHGGAGEITYETYIYKKENGHDNSGFDYINVTNTTVSWGSSEWNSKITKRGSVQWTDDVFEVAKDNGAYSYVTLPNSNKRYTIEQYMGMFIMN